MYAPHQVGPETGTLTILDIYGRPQTVALTGTGVAPAGISVLPTAVNFGDWGVAGTTASQAVTITDNGGLPLNTLTFAANGDFSIAGNSCTAMLTAGASCAVQLVFTPSQSGVRNGSLGISSPSLNKPFEIALSGNGLGFAFQAEGASSATVTGGQTASYILQVIPATGSAGMITFNCTAAPSNSICTVNPTSVQITGGVTDSVTVTVATAAQTSSDATTAGGNKNLFLAVLFPVCFLVLPFSRKKRLRLLGLIVLVALPLGCGVHANVGSTTGPVGGNPQSTPPATYNPVITATGPGISQSVTLTTIVE
jgi:hypothetical protein